MKTLYQGLLQRRADLRVEGNTLMEKAERTTEESVRLKEIGAQLEMLNGDIEQEERVREQLRQAPATVSYSITGMRDLAAEKPYKCFGEFMQEVAQAGMPGGVVPSRLLAASGMSVGVPSDGGFLVGQEYTTRLLTSAMEQSQLAPLCDSFPVGEGNDGIEAPYIDETDRANGSRWGGVRVYRRSEAGTVTATKPALGMFELRLEDMMGIAYATERSLRDARQLEAVFTAAFASEFSFKIDDELIRGTGAGESLGILNSPALVTVAKETGQAAKTIVTRNISNMWARMPAKLRGAAVWLYNQDCEPTLDELAIPVGTGALEPRFVSYGPDGVLRIKGRPALAVEQCETLGTVGDFMLVNWNEVVLIQKDMEAEQSIHLLFLYNERAFRWVYPIIAKPKWKSAKTPYKGTANTQSPFIALATRA